MKVYVIYIRDREDNGINSIVYVGTDARKAVMAYKTFETNHERTDVEVWVDGKSSLEEDEQFVALL